MKRSLNTSKNSNNILIIKKLHIKYKSEPNIGYNIIRIVF